MANTNTQISAYTDNRGPKFHELELLELVSQDYSSFSGRLLDIGCATGSFINIMAEAHPLASYTGIDISSSLIESASKLTRAAHVEFIVSDVLEFEPAEKYDIIVASGVLSIFDDFSAPLKNWLSWLRAGGKLYVFGGFNSENIDTIVHFRNNAIDKSAGWESGLTSYSTITVTKFLQELGFEASFKKFHLPIELPRDRDNPIRTYTVTTTDGQRLVLNGANINQEFFFLRVMGSS